ncbi:MAG TPA: restriction endonuclease [Anaerolineae bacterium]|nr:restriction endonuclease [Anaerolineae bacterium]
MKKNQADRLAKQHKKSKGVEGIFGDSAKRHDLSVKDVSIETFNRLKEMLPHLEFRYRQKIGKKEINEKLNKVDDRLGMTLFVKKSAIKPDGGIIEVKDKNDQWRIVLVSEAKHQGKDIENISKGILVGKNNDQDIMVAGNAIERSHKNINEIRNIMVDEKHFPYVLFLQGSNFLTEPVIVQRPDGRKVELRHDVGSLNRIDRLTAANYSMPINTNYCENIFIDVNEEKVMLQAVSIFAKATPWPADEMFSIMMEVALTSLHILGLDEVT